MVKGPPAAPAQPPKLELLLAVASASRSEHPAPNPFSSAVVLTLIVLAAYATPPDSIASAAKGSSVSARYVRAFQPHDARERNMGPPSRRLAAIVAGRSPV